MHTLAPGADFWLPNPPQKTRMVGPIRVLMLIFFCVLFLCCVRSFSRRPKRRPRGPKTLPRVPQEAPRGRQERPRSLQEGLKSTPGGSKKASRTAKLHPRCPAKMPCRELTTRHAQSFGRAAVSPQRGRQYKCSTPDRRYR